MVEHDMREIDVREIGDRIREMAVEVSWNLGTAERECLRRLSEEEESPLGRKILSAIVSNFEIAAAERRPLCQDTGLAVVFLEIGQNVRLVGGSLLDAVNAGVRTAYRDALLRMSVLNDPLLRANTKDNTPAIVHIEIVPGDRVRILFGAKGGGCENMSRSAMLNPSDGKRGVVEFVTRAVQEASANPCPPVVVGVGLGGTFEKAAILAKKALFRPLGKPNSQLHLADLERELLDSINRTGVGPMGMGGTRTAMAVHVEAFPCHIASLPVAVNLDCHSHRHMEAEI
ncbi:MAG: fumarate hydratase [Planctomycetota bacterium]|nr:fumarate hydratase [Planctomycetota bacterium]